MSESKSESRVLDVFGPNLVIESNGPVGLGGGISYQLYSVTDKGMKYQQALHASGLATIDADGTLEIQTGRENNKDAISYMAMAHNGDMCMTAENGWIRIFGKNIVLEAANELLLQGKTVTLGNFDGSTESTAILGGEITVGSKETKIIEVVRSKRITRMGGSIFLKHPLGQLSAFAGVAQAAFIGPFQASLTRPREFRGGQTPPPTGLARVVGGTVDALTGNLTDFDQRGSAGG